MSRESFKQSLGHGMVSFGLVALIGLVGSVVIARIYGVEVIGQFALTLAPVAILTYLSTVQEQAALIKELSLLEPRDPRVTGLAAAVFGFSTTLTFIVGAIVAVVSAWVLANPMGQPDLVRPMVVQLAGYVVVTNTCWNVDSVLNAFRSGRALLWVRFVQAVSFLTIAVVWGVLEQSVWGLVWATIGSWALSLVLRVRALSAVMCWRVPRPVIAEGWRALPRLVGFGVRAAPGGILVGINSESGTWILGVTSPVATVGAWNRARQLGDRLQEGLIRLNEVLLPTLAERRGLGDDEGHDRAWADSVRYGLVALLLIAAAGGGAAEGIMNVFGPGFSAGSTALALILLYQAIHAVDSIHVTALFVANRPLLTTAAAGAAMVVGVTVSVFGAIWFGVAGPALGLIASAFVAIAVMHGAVRSMLVTPLSQLWPARQMVAILVAYATGFAASYALDRTLDGHLGTIAALAAGTVVYLAVFVLLGGVGGRDRDRLAQLRARLGSRGAGAGA